MRETKLTSALREYPNHFPTAMHAVFVSTWRIFSNPPLRPNWGGLAAAGVYAHLAIAWKPAQRANARQPNPASSPEKSANEK